MFDVSNFLETNIIQTPWRHQIVKSFFNEIDFNIVRDGAQRLLTVNANKTKFGENGINIFEAKEYIGQEAYDIICDANRKLLDAVPKIYQCYPNHRVFEKLISIPTFHLLCAGHVNNAVHDEVINKTCSIVVYVSPSVSSGTSLYSNSDSKSFVREVSWEPNTAIAFCPQSGVTWHDFHNHHSGTRITLNFFIEKDFSETIVETPVSFLYKVMEKSVTIPKNNISIDAVKVIKTGYHSIDLTG